MALSVKVISFLSPSVPPGPPVLQPITGVGFRPTLAYLFSTTSSDGSARASFSEGIDDAVTHVGRGAGFGIGVACGNVGWSSGTYSLIPVNNNAINTILVAGYIASFDADGLTIHWDSVNGFSASQPTLRWIAVLIGGISAKVGIHGPYGTGLQPVSGLGFAPTGVPFAWFNGGIPGALVPAFSTGTATYSTAGSPGCTSQAGLAVSATCAGGVTDTKSRLNGGAFTMDVNGVTSTFVSLDADGFTFSAAVSGAGGYLAYAAVAGCAINVGVFTLVGGGGAQTFPLEATSPRLLVVLGIDKPRAAGTVDDLLLTVGAATASEQMNAWTGNLDAKGGAGFLHNRTDTGRLITVATPTGASASTVVYQASFTSFGAQAFTITPTLDDGVTREWISVVVADDIGTGPCGGLLPIQCVPDVPIIPSSPTNPTEFGSGSVSGGGGIIV